MFREPEGAWHLPTSKTDIVVLFKDRDQQAYPIRI